MSVAFDRMKESAEKQAKSFGGQYLGVFRGTPSCNHCVDDFDGLEPIPPRDLARDLAMGQVEWEKYLEESRSADLDDKDECTECGQTIY